MESLDCDNLGDLAFAEGIIREWSKDRPVVYMDHITRRYRKRTRDVAQSITGTRPDYYKIMREEWAGRDHVEKCTIILYAHGSTTEVAPGPFRQMIRDMILQFEKVKIEPGTMVGVQAAQSVGESMTQASLNTFHLAGAKRSVTTGITRLKELLNCTYQVPVPYFSNVTCKSPERLKEVRLRDVMEINPGSPVVWDVVEDKAITMGTRVPTATADNKNCRYQIRFCLKDASWWPKIAQSRSIPNIVLNVLRSDDGLNVYTEFPRSTDRVSIMKRLGTMLEYHVEGVPGANDVDGDTLFLHRYHNTPTLMDFFDVCPDLDLTKMSTNSISFIQNTLGIEAVREYLVREITRVLSDEGIHVNRRHILLIVDNMTYGGAPQANLYSAISLTDNAILKATFQQHTETFATAAAMGVRDSLKDVSSQVLMGKLAGVGTESGTSKIVYKEVGPIVEKETETYLDSPEYAPLSPEYAPTSPGGHYYPHNSPEYIPSSPVLAPASPEFIMPNLTI
jgi:hypothetical protein